MEDKLTDIIAPAVEGLGFELVRVKILGGRRPTIQVMAERPDRTMPVEDCAALSRELSAVLDVADPMEGEYFLEVSSPGIDRPLTRFKDYADFEGFEAKVETKMPVKDRRKFRGVLAGAKDNSVKLQTRDETFEFALDEIEKAKLVLTDALIEATAGAHDDKQTTVSPTTE